MSSLIEAFLSGSQRVSARIFYYIPLKEGQDKLVVSPNFIGHQPVELSHTNILQEFIFQIDDKPDLRDERLAKVFAELVLMKNGVIRIQDRTQRMAIMNEDLAVNAQSLSNVVPVMIPRPEEEANSGMTDIVTTFKAMVPYPRVRKFLQFWQEELDGPINHVQLAAAPIPRSDWVRKHSDYKLN